MLNTSAEPTSFLKVDIMRKYHKILLCWLAFWAVAPLAFAQTSAISGFVTDGSDGQALEGATVALYNPAETALLFGTATNSEGFYLISKVTPGRYVARISFVGYEPHQMTLELEEGNVATLSVTIAPDPEALDEVVVETERTSGVARIEAGRQRIRAPEIELIPAPDITGDLANYLTSLPGVVTTGDRGGQFFVRGGEPPQNLAMLDGMIIYQPFHVLGFYSLFPSEIIDKADFYAGGFGAKYVGRLSSVLDVSARPGNNRRFSGSVSVSPFTGSALLEGPLIPGVASFIVSGRQSLIDQSSEALYGQNLPFDFNDRFLKLHFTPGSRHRISFTGIRSTDEGELVEDVAAAEAQKVWWTNDGFSLSWLALSKNLPIATKLTYSRSGHQTRQGTPGLTQRMSEIKNSRLALDATFSEGSFFGARSTTIAGWDVVFGNTANELSGLFQNLEDSGRPVPSFGFYVEPEITTSGGWKLSPGLRFQAYNTRLVPVPEPRFRASLERGKHFFSGAISIHNQQIIGLSDRRDASNVFTVWTGIPSEGSIGSQADLEILRDRIGKSLHVLLGYRSNATEWFEYALEGFYKRYGNLFVSEWTAFPRLTTRLQTATGRSFGLEARIELRRSPFYAFITYGLSNTEYAADNSAIAILYGSDRLHYRPPHDRRHNVNALVSVTLSGFDISLRWQFGSGLPYTKPLAFDGFALIDDIRTVFEAENSRRVVYDRPYGDILPTYHRLDASVERTWKIRRAALTFQGSVINIYDRRNIFYLDIFTLRRSDQLPFLPSAGLKVAFE